MNCSGDGSYGQGRAHEALLMAANWKLPIILFCENNGMSIFATASEMHPTENISSLAQGYDMPATVVDGQDVFAVAEVVLPAVERARSGGGPSFIEAKCLRFREHDIGTPDLEGWEERSSEALAQLKERTRTVGNRTHARRRRTDPVPDRSAARRCGSRSCAGRSLR